MWVENARDRWKQIHAYSAPSFPVKNCSASPSLHLKHSTSNQHYKTRWQVLEPVILFLFIFFLIIHYTFKYFVFKYFFFVLIFSSLCRFSQFKFPNVNSRFFICIPLYSFLLLNILVIAIITSYFLLTYSILNFYFLTIFFLWLIHKLNNEVLMFVSV